MQYFITWTKKHQNVTHVRHDNFLTFAFASHKSVTYVRHISEGKKFDHVPKLRKM